MNIQTPLRALRKSKNLSLNEVAKALETDPGNLSRIETGKQKPKLPMLERIIQLFGTEITEMEILFPELYTENKE